MGLAQSLQIGLKEWAVVCGALEAGRQIMLLRKGGIYEAAGEFELEHPQFLLFPAYLHQKPAMLKAEAQPSGAPQGREPEQVTLSSAATVSDIVQLHSRDQMDALEERHVWTPALIDMRFGYRPENPLYLLLLRVYRLSEAVTIPNTPAYAGCKSWVPLEQPVSTAGAVPVLDEALFAREREAILAALR